MSEISTGRGKRWCRRSADGTAARRQTTRVGFSMSSWRSPGITASTPFAFSMGCPRHPPRRSAGD